MNILITGTSGYIGGMLADQYTKRDDVSQIICIDKDPLPQWLAGNPKIIAIQANLAIDNWQDEVNKTNITIDSVVHCAWQIRDWYGGRETVRMWNLQGSASVFQWVLDNPSATRLVYFSSIAQFGADKKNSESVLFTTDSETRMTGYCYADDKYEVDYLLRDMLQDNNRVQVTVIKPSTVTGPRGRIGVGKFSLAAALSADANKSAIPWPVQWMLRFMPVIGRWTRQFVHEDDIADVVTLGLFTQTTQQFGTYIVSPNDIIDGKEMANLTGKIAIYIPPRLAQIGFGFVWHLTRGRIPTAPGVWKFMAYPICVDGSLVTTELGHTYSYSSKQAISELRGRYTPSVKK